MQVFKIQKPEDVEFLFDTSLRKWVIKRLGIQIGPNFSDQYVSVQVTLDPSPSATQWGQIELNDISAVNFNPDKYTTHFSTNQGITTGSLDDMKLGTGKYENAVGATVTRATFVIGTDDIRIFRTFGGSTFDIEDYAMVLRVENNRFNIWYREK